MGMLDTLGRGLGMLSSPQALSTLQYLQMRHHGMMPGDIAAQRAQQSYYESMNAQRQAEEEERLRKIREAEMNAAIQGEERSWAQGQLTDPAARATLATDPARMMRMAEALPGPVLSAAMGAMNPQGGRTKVAERIGPDNVKYITWRDATGKTSEEAVGPVRPTQGTSVSVNVADDSYLKWQGKNTAQWESDLGTTASKAQAQIDQLDRLSVLSNSVKTGAISPKLKTIGAVLQSVNLDPASFGIDPNLPATGQAIDSIAASLTLAKIGGEGGMPANNFSDADRDFIKSTVPSLANTPWANQVITQASKAVANRQIEKYMAWLEYAGTRQEEGKAPSRQSFELEWIKRTRSTPLFPVVATPEERAQLPPGTIYTAPNGEVKVAR